MIYLVFSILSSTVILAIFRYFERFKIDVFQAIVFNYLTAFLCGTLLYSEDIPKMSISATSLLPFLSLCGCLFISLFYLMGLSAQRNGMGKTSVAVKMSMALSVVALMIFNKDNIEVLKIIGLFVGLGGVYLVTSDQSSGKKQNLTSALLLIVLFIGSALLDIVLNYGERALSAGISSALLSAFGFGVAGMIGFLIFAFQLLRSKANFYWRNVLGGIVLGIPNYFSIFLLLKSYSSNILSDSSILAVTNISIVVGSSFLGLVLFNESLNKRKRFGIVLSILTIVLLSI